MTGHIDPHPDRGLYEIRVGGHLDDRWSHLLDGARLHHEAGATTRIDSPAIDQAALHGLLRRIRDAGLLLISIRQVDDLTATPSTDTTRSTTP